MRGTRAIRAALALLCMAGLTIPPVAAAAAGAADEAARRAFEDEQARNDTRAMLERMKSMQEERRQRENQLPYPDPVIDGHALPPSPWLEAEKGRYRALLTEFRADVLIVPVQGQAAGVSRSTRALMTESLAAALAPGQRVAPPRLVAGALGDGLRQADRTAVIALANALKVRRILWVWAGHRKDQRLHVHFEVQDLGRQLAFTVNDARAAVTVEPLPFSDERVPLDVFRAALPRMVEALGYPPPRSARVAAGNLSERWPATLADIARAGVPAADRALHLQVLASLLPRDVGRARERLFERSLAIAWQLPPDHPSTRLLQARAYHGLGMRHAALAQLARSNGTAERALVAALNGNLDELDALRGKLAQSPLRLLAEIDATDIRFAYERDTAASVAEREALLVTLPAWLAPLAARRFIDAEPTALRHIDTLPVLELLGQTFPGAGPAVNARLRGGAVAGRSEAVDVELGLAPYLRADLVKLAPHLCCDAAEADKAGLTRLDLADFLIAAMAANVTFKATRLIDAQGAHRAGLRYLDDVAAVYDGHPDLFALRARAERNLAAAADPALRDTLAQRAGESNDRAWAWRAWGGEQASDRPSGVVRPPQHTAAERRQVVEDWGPEVRAALANATYRVEMLRAAFELADTVAEREALLKAAEGRFGGSAERYLLQAELETQRGRPEAARALLGEAVARGLPAWDLYQKLGVGLMDDGRYAEAAKAFNAYPGFRRDAAVHPVTRDNHAYAAGSLLYWRDRSDLALPLYRLAAGSDTGSSASLISSARIALLAGDYETAARHYHDNMRHYDFAWSHRDFYAVMHMLGEGATAWDGFKVTAPRLRVPQLWHAALVGHRREGLSEAQLARWLRDNGFVRDQQADVWAVQYLAMAAMTDRVPGNAAIEELERIVNVRRDSSLLLPLVRASRAMAQRDFAAAERMLGEAIDKAGKLELARVSYVLPQYALAALRSGQGAAAERRLAALPPAVVEPMDLLLARAVLDAAPGKANAVAGLEKAFARRVFAENRALPVEYQFAALAMSLHEFTRVAGYRDFALRMARFNQRVQPWEAWSHALAAALLPPGEERRSALRRAVYLDPQSRWLSSVPAEEVVAARATLQGGSPFAAPPSRSAARRGA